MNFIGATASFIGIFLCGYMWWEVRLKKERKRTQSVLLGAICTYGTFMWGFRGVDPERAIGVDPAITIMYAGYLSILWFTVHYVLGTGKPQFWSFLLDGAMRLAEMRGSECWDSGKEGERTWLSLTRVVFESV